MSTTLSIPYASLIRKVDPNFSKDRRKTLEYVFTRRRFFGLYDERGPYAEAFLTDEHGDLLLAEDGTYILTESPAAPNGTFD